LLLLLLLSLSRIDMGGGDGWQHSCTNSVEIISVYLPTCLPACLPAWYPNHLWHGKRRRGSEEEGFIAKWMNRTCYRYRYYQYYCSHRNWNYHPMVHLLENIIEDVLYDTEFRNDISVVNINKNISSKKTMITLDIKSISPKDITT